MRQGSRTCWVVLAMLLLGACSGSGDDHVRTGRAAETASDSTTTTTSTSTDSSSTTSTISTASTEPVSPTTQVEPLDTVVDEPTTATIETPASASRLLYMGRANLVSDDPLDVWSAALDGTDRRIVASGLAVRVDAYNKANLSPDGTELAYVHNGDNRVHVRRLDDGSDVVVSGNPSFRAFWLDGTTVVYSNADDSTTWIVNADGSGDRLLAAGDLWSATYDGRAIVRAGYDEMLVVTRDGDATRIAEQEASVLSGVLAPDGEHAAWTEASGCRCPSAVVLIGRPDRSEARVLPGGGDSGDSYFGRTSPSWADGATVFAIRPEVAIDRTTLDGDPVDVITFDGGYWDFLGVR